MAKLYYFENSLFTRPYQLVSDGFELSQAEQYWTLWDQIGLTMDKIQNSLAGQVYRWHDTSQNQEPFGSRMVIEFSNQNDLILFRLSVNDELVPPPKGYRRISRQNWP